MLGGAWLLKHTGQDCPSGFDHNRLPGAQFAGLTNSFDSVVFNLDESIFNHFKLFAGQHPSLRIVWLSGKSNMGFIIFWISRLEAQA